MNLNKKKSSNYLMLFFYVFQNATLVRKLEPARFKKTRINTNTIVLNNQLLLKTKKIHLQLIYFISSSKSQTFNYQIKPINIGHFSLPLHFAYFRLFARFFPRRTPSATLRIIPITIIVIIYIYTFD